MKISAFARLVMVFAVLFLMMAAPAMAQQGGLFLAGAAEADITPEVDQFEDRNGNGVFDLGDPTKSFGFGDKVISFKEGRILIGNGEGEAKFIYDKLSTYALVVENPATGIRVALVSADVYLLTGPDIQAIRDKVDPADEIDFIVISATHNHMGPDTLGLSGVAKMPIPKMVNALLKDSAGFESGINPVWFEDFQDKIADCIHRAAQNMRPANITVATTQFTFGLIDLREPHINDPNLNVMAVDGVDGKPIATLMQWASHPEAVLVYGFKGREYKPLPYDSLSKADLEGWGLTLTAGFPGYARKEMRKLRGGVPMYFNGAVGGMQTPIRAILWDPEKHPEFPIDADPDTVPEDIRIPNDFRYAPVLGRELAKAAVKGLEEKGEQAKSSKVTFAKADVLVPMENYLFRAMSSMNMLGQTPGHLYDDQGKIDDSFGSWIGGLFVPGIRAATGKNLMAEVSVVNIGNAQIVNVPGEPVPELIRGLPEDFYSNSAKYFPKEAEFHASGSDFKLSQPSLAEASNADHLFVFGLSGGEMGYILPEADFNPPHDIKVPPLRRWWICFDAEQHPHYEESMAVGSKLESILMGKLVELLQANPVEK